MSRRESVKRRAARVYRRGERYDQMRLSGLSVVHTQRERERKKEGNRGNHEGIPSTQPPLCARPFPSLPLFPLSVLIKCGLRESTPILPSSSPLSMEREKRLLCLTAANSLSSFLLFSATTLACRWCDSRSVGSKRERKVAE
mmetsp:Transcript_52988/g.103651  ORF Transcript_52988/g.103651 Transcript_52988/m.103651 type:complete len:142 (+) Transcript_52988:1179-1604(+)